MKLNESSANSCQTQCVSVLFTVLYIKFTLNDRVSKLQKILHSVKTILETKLSPCAFLYEQLSNDNNNIHFTYTYSAFQDTE